MSILHFLMRLPISIQSDPLTLQGLSQTPLQQGAMLLCSSPLQYLVNCVTVFVFAVLCLQVSMAHSEGRGSF